MVTSLKADLELFFAAVQSLSHVPLFVTHGLYVAHQASLSRRFPRQAYWSGLPFPSPGDLPDPGIKPEPPALTGGFFTTETPGKPWDYSRFSFNYDKLSMAETVSKLNVLNNKNLKRLKMSLRVITHNIPPSQESKIIQHVCL